MLRRRTMRGPVTGLFHTPVCTVRPRHGTSLGTPTLTDTSVATLTTLLETVTGLPGRLTRRGTVHRRRLFPAEESVPGHPELRRRRLGCPVTGGGRGLPGRGRNRCEVVRLSVALLRHLVLGADLREPELSERGLDLLAHLVGQVAAGILVRDRAEVDEQPRVPPTELHLRRSEQGREHVLDDA